MDNSLYLQKILEIYNSIKMRDFFVMFAVALLLVSCAKKNPIVFQKQTDMFEVTVSLDTNGTFRYTANSPVGAAFDESGTYSILDSLLILQFKYDNYEHLCYTVPLSNDTSIIATVGNITFLFPAAKEIEETGFHRTDADIISELNELKSNFQLQDSIGTRYLKKISGDLSLILK